MASQYETGFYMDNGYYGGQVFIGADIDEALEKIDTTSDISDLIHDYVYVEWEIDREEMAHNIAYEGLLDLTFESIAWAALNSIQEGTSAKEGPVYGHVYWWEPGFSDSPRPPPNALMPPVTNVKYTANRKSGSSKARPKAPAKRSTKKAPSKSGNARPKARTKVTSGKKTTANRRRMA